MRPARALLVGGVLLALVATVATACTGIERPQPLLPGAPVESALDWLQDLVRVGEKPCRDRGTDTSRLCRGYQDRRGHRYIAVHDPITLELVRILEVRESRFGRPIQDLLWHPEDRPSIHRVQGVSL